MRPGAATSKDTSAYKIAFFQDECTRCRRRFEFLNEHEIDCVYTCLEPSEFAKVYGRYTNVPRLESNIPGYVSEDLIEAAHRFAVPDHVRTVDVGYRGRPLPPYLGHGAMEKHEIGARFAELASDSGLRLDIFGAETDRLYGDDWYRFLASCRCMLGVESGVSAFDLEDEVFTEYTELERRQDRVALEDLTSLPRWEDKVYYRTISPRHFEAAAFRICQVLYEGHYSGVLKPMTHYVPLKKDFSNIDQVIGLIRDAEVRRELTGERLPRPHRLGGLELPPVRPGSGRPAREGRRRRPAGPQDGTTGRPNSWSTVPPSSARRRVHWRTRRLLAHSRVQRLLRFIHPVTSRVRHLIGIPAPGEQPLNGSASLLVVYSVLESRLRESVRDHLYSLERHSSHRSVYLNLAVRRVPSWLRRVPFDAVVFHTTFLSKRANPAYFQRLCARAEPLKGIGERRVALPQDEYLPPAPLCDFISDFGVDHVLSVAPESEWPAIYPTVDRERVGISRVLTGYLEPGSVDHLDTELWLTSARHRLPGQGDRSLARSPRTTQGRDRTRLRGHGATRRPTLGHLDAARGHPARIRLDALPRVVQVHARRGGGSEPPGPRRQHQGLHRALPHGAARCVLRPDRGRVLSR